MPPRKSKAGQANITAETRNDVKTERDQNGEQEVEDTKESHAGDAEDTSSKKRKQPAKPDTEPKKAARRSGRNSSLASATPEQVLNFILSEDALELCQPSVENETNASQEADRSSLRLYTKQATLLNPFEELMSAAILSRPISHRLGHRTIRTVLNKPYSFSSAQKVQDAGRDKISEAIWEAKTQHKEKTAQEIWDIASTVLESYSDGDGNGETLVALREQCDRNMDKERGELQKIKGLGKTGLDIFFRRIQWQWQEAYPYIDSRTADALRTIGLPSTANALDDFLGKQGKSEEDKRKTFVVILERAVGASLEGNADALLERAGE